MPLILYFVSIGACLIAKPVKIIAGLIVFVILTFGSLIGYMLIQWWWWRYDKSRLNSCNVSNFLWGVSELFLFFMFLCSISLVWCFISWFEPNVFTKNLKFYMNSISFTGLKESFLKLDLAEVSLYKTLCSHSWLLI